MITAEPAVAPTRPASLEAMRPPVAYTAYTAAPGGGLAEQHWSPQRAFTRSGPGQDKLLDRARQNNAGPYK
ncbi:hypothetical protein NDU88_012288 [Pleurodeles waltl]|uniref:Uncharacterized protein n=1 Tax=Pleurodeles waltl TaxID=8319 RepID=A0AAV7R3V4_PLEWA|nr:hypothetical protein NDU88_012288 [Pleurodeles waltl]